MVNFGGGMVTRFVEKCLRDVFGVGCGMSAICLRENNNKTFYMLVSRLFPRFGGGYGGKCGGKLF